MKKATIGLALLFALCALPALAGDIPDLKGTWAAETVNIAGVRTGFIEQAAPSSTLVIEEQRGRVFTGLKTWTVKGETYSERFAGGITADNEIYIAEERDGEMRGDYDPKTKALLLFYVEGGPNAKVFEGVYVKKP